MELISIAIFACIGTLVGHYYRDIKERLKELEKPKPDIGVTYGETVRTPISNTGEIGISEPKSPQLVEFEAREALEKAQYNVKVKPK